MHQVLDDGHSSQKPARRRRLGKRFVRLGLLVATLALALRFSGYMESLFYQPTAGPTPVPASLRGAELVAFDSRDGTRLCGWFVPATPGAHDRQTPGPTILHVHGNAGNVSDHSWFTEYLPSAGFNVFIFDYRGYGQSEGRAWTRGPLIADTHAALDYLLTRRDVDPARIGMYGQSLGGSIGLNMMAERSEIRAAVIESAFASWRDEAANALGGDPAPLWARALAWILIPDGQRPDEAIARCTPRPILILHGDADTTIPIAHGRRLKHAGGATVELLEFPGGNHNTLRETHPEVEAAITTFFRRHLTN